MKIILSDTELQAALRTAYPVPEGYCIENVAFQKYSTDFCTIELARVTDSPVVACTQLGLKHLPIADDAVAA